MRLLLPVFLLAACNVDAVVTKEIFEDPSWAARFTYQPRDRVLITYEHPEEDLCAGVLLGRGIGDGIPGQLLELPSEWALEVAYRSTPSSGCHERFPQLHRIEQAYAGVGYVDWDDTYPELPPTRVDVEVSMRFDLYPYELDLSADAVTVEAPGEP